VYSLHLPCLSSSQTRKIICKNSSLCQKFHKLQFPKSRSTSRNAFKNVTASSCTISCTNLTPLYSRPYIHTPTFTPLQSVRSRTSWRSRHKLGVILRYARHSRMMCKQSKDIFHCTVIYACYRILYFYRILFSILILGNNTK